MKKKESMDYEDLMFIKEKRRVAIEKQKKMKKRWDSKGNDSRYGKRNKFDLYDDDYE